MNKLSSQKNTPREFATHAFFGDIQVMNLAHFRNLRGLTQIDLADMIGVKQPTIHRAEKMQASAKLKTYIDCAKVLNVSLSDIFNELRDPVEAQILDVVHRLGPLEKQRILGILTLAEGYVHERGQEKTSTDHH